MHYSFSAAHSALAFPLGGIGTGNVSLGARGELRDWEIFNAPAKGKLLPNTFFTIRVQARISRRSCASSKLSFSRRIFCRTAIIPRRTAACRASPARRFTGEYPFARVELTDPALPVRVELEAFTPLIPLNPEDSGIPCAALTYTVTNISDQPIDVTLVGSLCNPVGGVQLDAGMNIAPSKKGKTLNTFAAKRICAGCS